MTNESTWVIQAQQGDQEAFTRLVEIFQTPVYNLCYRMLGVPEAAEDAAQETFLRVYQKLSHYDRARSFATWLLSIAAHHCIDRLRRKRFSSFSIDDAENDQVEIPDHSALDPEDETAKRQERERLHNCLKFLDSISRAAIILRYWQCCSEEEIARVLNLSFPAVKSRLHRSRRLLADLWDEKPAQSRTERQPYRSPVPGV